MRQKVSKTQLDTVLQFAVSRTYGGFACFPTPEMPTDLGPGSLQVAEELGFKTDDGYVAKGMAQLSVYAKA